MRCFSAFFGLPASSEFLTEGVTDRSCGYNAIVAAFDACSRNKRRSVNGTTLLFCRMAAGAGKQEAFGKL